MNEKEVGEIRRRFKDERNAIGSIRGCYVNELSAAREKLNERYQTECRLPYNNPSSPKQKSSDDRER